MAAPLHFPWRIWKITWKAHSGKASIKVVIETMEAFPKQDPPGLILCWKSDFSLVNFSKL